MKRLPYHLSKSILWLFFLLFLGNTPAFSQANAKLERVKTLFYHQQYDKALSLIKATRQLNKDHKAEYNYLH